MSNPIFCSSCGYTPHECDPCRERLLDKLGGVCARTPNFHPDDRVGDCPDFQESDLPSQLLGQDDDAYRPDCGLGYSALEIDAEPNRFDPYEALDRVMDFVQAGYDGILDDEMHRNAQGFINALRAYITGMEQ